MKMILGITFFVLLVGIVANAILPGSYDLIQVPDTTLDSSWWQNIPFIGELLSADVWLANSLVVFLAIMTFQVDEIPTLVNTLIFVPIALALLWMIIGLVRGTSTE